VTGTVAPVSEVTTYYLEMNSPDRLRESRGERKLRVVEAGFRQFQYNRFLYQLVGQNWEWTDKLAWSNDQWREYVEQENLRTWVAYAKGTPAGYYELLQTCDGNTEIACFGLAREFIGRGYGGFLLTHALRSAWAWTGTRRVWLHTCTLDHPGALGNYLARGMEIYREETHERTLHDARRTTPSPGVFSG